jgi:tripartite-type tricarboxylate transporter receptor subunit TctC
MKMRYAYLFVALCLLGIGLPAPTASFSAEYPDHTIQLIIPNVAGSQMDITGRILAEELGQILGQKVIISNKPGAGTVLGTDAALRSKKDGYTLLYSSAGAVVYSQASNPEVVHYDPVKDAEPLGLHFFFPHVVSVKSDAPWKTFPQLIDYAKKNPGKLRISTIGVGSTPHFLLEMIQSITGAQFIHVPFEGGESVVTAVLGGHVEITCDSFTKLKPHSDAGKIRNLLITHKMPGYLDIPLMTEVGYKQSLPASWFAIFAPAGIPEDVKKILVPAVEKAVKKSKAKTDQLGNIVEYRPPAELKKMIEEESKRARDLAIKIGLLKS